MKMGWEPIIPLLIGLGGLIVTLVTVVLSHRERIRERTGTYREALYAKQIEAVTDLFESFHSLSITASAVLAGLKQNELEARAHFSKELEEKHLNTFNLLARITPLQPNSVMSAATRNLTLASALIEIAESNDTTPLKDVFTAIHVAELELLLSTRQALGTDALSEETVKLFEARSKYDYEEILKHYIKGYESELGHKIGA